MYSQTAGEINSLATSSRETANGSSENNGQIRSAIEQIVADTKNLLDIVSGVNMRKQNLAASTEEISAGADVINETVSQVREELRRLEEQSREAV